MIDEPENQAETDAKRQTRNDRKVDRRVLGFVGEVAGELAEAEGQFAAEVEQRTDEDEDAAEDEERAAEFAKVHRLRDGGNTAK